MTYSLKIWNKPGSDDVRLYINGTTRQSVYLKKSREGSGRIVWSSKANDTPHRFQTGDHYGKCRKDEAAAREVMEAYGLEFRKDGEWERALAFAQQGIEMEG